jgi:hypothetical protein
MLPYDENLAPEKPAAQPPAGVTVEIRLRLPLARPHPRVRQDELGHACVRWSVDQRGRGRVTQAPQTNLANRLLQRQQTIDRGTDIVVGILEAPVLAVAVAHTAEVEPQHRDAAPAQLTCQKNELAMALDRYCEPPTRTTTARRASARIPR